MTGDDDALLFVQFLYKQRQVLVEGIHDKDMFWALLTSWRKGILWGIPWAHFKTDKCPIDLSVRNKQLLLNTIKVFAEVLL